MYYILKLFIYIFKMELIIDNFDLSLLDKKYIASQIKDSKELKLELLFSSNFINTWIIRKIIWIVCDELNIDNRMKFKIILIVDELNNNAIEYWSKDKDLCILRLNIKSYNNYYELNLEVEDSGKWEDHKTAKDMIKLGNDKIKQWFMNHSSIRWRGLFLIIKNIVDELYFRDSNKWWLIVGIKKKINK